MSKDELIKILEEYEMFVDDDFGGSYESIIAYAPNKTISRAHTPIAVLNIIDTFEKIQQENKKYKEVTNKLKQFCNNDDNFLILDAYSQDDVYEIQEKLLDMLKEVEHE